MYKIYSQLCSTGKHTQCFVIAYTKKNLKIKKIYIYMCVCVCVCVCITESLCWKLLAGFLVITALHSLSWKIFAYIFWPIWGEKFKYHNIVNQLYLN